MKAPNFDNEGADNETYAPVRLSRDSDGDRFRLVFCDWEWLHAQCGGDTVNEYYLNGYGVDALVKACRLNAGLDPEADGIDSDPEGDACCIYFDNLEDAVETAHLLCEMLHDRTKLIAMTKIVYDNDWYDS